MTNEAWILVVLAVALVGYAVSSFLLIGKQKAQAVITPKVDVDEFDLKRMEDALRWLKRIEDPSLRPKIELSDPPQIHEKPMCGVSVNSVSLENLRIQQAIEREKNFLEVMSRSDVKVLLIEFKAYLLKNELYEYCHYAAQMLDLNEDDARTQLMEYYMTQEVPLVIRMDRFKGCFDLIIIGE